MPKKIVTPEVNYGPLKGLIGTWKGDKGMDISPEVVGDEKNAYYETVIFEAAGDLTNAGTQKIAMVRYHLVVTKKINDEVFHDQVGYWLWDAESSVIMHSLTVPRGLCVLAGGTYKNKSKTAKTITLEVKAGIKDKSWGIVQSPFMNKNAKTLEFRQKIIISAKKLEYAETTVLKIYGRKFDHTDNNVLVKIK